MKQHSSFCLVLDSLEGYGTGPYGWLRSLMSECRLTGLALLNFHRDIPVNAESVIEKFAKKRFLDFVI